MIFSREYTSFCDRIAGTSLHHTPEGTASSVDSKRAIESRESYERTLADYAAVFGEAPPDLWPSLTTKGAEGANACGTSCRGCGRGCSSCGHGCRGCTRCSRG
jgi:hypothetical protein